MLDDTIRYLGVHPGVLTSVAIAVVLAIVGLWYVISHHLHAILITLLSAAGAGSGVLVITRGYRAGMNDLIWVGLFLIVIFPIIYWQAIKQIEPMEPRTGRGRMRTMLSRKAG
jgi:hypothetical protein